MLFRSHRRNTHNSPWAVSLGWGSPAIIYHLGCPKQSPARQISRQKQLFGVANGFQNSSESCSGESKARLALSCLNLNRAVRLHKFKKVKVRAGSAATVGAPDREKRTMKELHDGRTSPTTSPYPVLVVDSYARGISIGRIDPQGPGLEIGRAHV